MANAAGFQHLCGPFVTILSSKNSQRYRIQSDNLPALWLLIQSLENRLQAMFDRSTNTNSDSGSPLEFSYSASLPLHEYFTEIETHFHKRNKLQLLMVSRYHRGSWDDIWKFSSKQTLISSNFFNLVYRNNWHNEQHNFARLKKGYWHVSRIKPQFRWRI